VAGQGSDTTLGAGTSTSLDWCRSALASIAAFLHNAAMTSVSVAKLASIGVMAIGLGIVTMSISGATGRADGPIEKAAVVACNSDAQTVETAVAAFHVDNPGLATTPAALVSSSHDGPFLSSWPKNGSHYSMSVTSAGALMVSAPSTSTARPYATSNPCGSAA
jgi:hypothetical protein